MSLDFSYELRKVLSSKQETCAFVGTWSVVGEQISRGVGR